jgi:RNA polymerase sigma-70 factor, ECF subfamily
MSDPAESRFSAAKSAGQTFRATYDEHFGFVWRCLRGLGVAESQIDDAAQEVFVVIHRGLAAFRGDSSIKTWIYGIVRNVARNQRRGQRHQRDQRDLDHATPSGAPDPEAQLQALQRARFVQIFLEGLDERNREVFVLAFLEQMSGPEIAEILAIPLNTAYSRLRVSRLAFEAAIQNKRGTL